MQYAAHSKANVNLNNYIINIKYRQLQHTTNARFLQTFKLEDDWLVDV